jgi:uncharacterized protein involved in copper resistance
MNAITRGRTIAAAGFLAASTLLGTALAAGPAMQNQGHAAMTHEGTPAMEHEATLAMEHDGTPGMEHEATLAMEHEGTPGMEHDATLAAVRKVRPAPWEVAKPAPQHEVVLTGMVDE